MARDAPITFDRPGCSFLASGFEGFIDCDTDRDCMPEITPLDKMRLPFGGQEVEFQHLTHESGGVPFLRIRIREHKRFTIFDVDPVSAQKWADLMQAWAKEHAGDAP
ncbi:MAG: hypothetical protein V2I51_07090 [Anderseniella sp.]|jgi:hypothetical protein|nr:hypothetical protein [Anderseniella sp.]